jgi:CheY-like chemotaxis protein
MVEVAFEDNGVGMAPEFLPRVFELFTQAAQGIDRRVGGLGIGLAVVGRVIQQHGGQVAAESPGLGRGSRFTVRLPRVASAAQVSEPLRAPLPTRPTARRLLLVDDNQDSLEMMSEFLTGLGHEVRGAGEGEGAIKAVSTFSPEIIFLDIGLPGLSGYDLARALRKLPHCANVPIVALSGYSRDQDKALAKEAGFSLHLAKPLDPVRLTSIIERLTSASVEARNGAPDPSRPN